MPNFNYDWTSQNIELFNATLSHLKGAPARGLEIGSFEGRSALWFCENILTHPDARLTCIDTFAGSAEHAAIDTINLLQRFQENTDSVKDKIKIQIGNSSDVLPRLPNARLPDLYDFIYVDGSHDPRDVCLDGILAWSLLKPGGVMIFDDYLWGAHLPPHKRPCVGIDAFLSVHDQEFAFIAKAYALAIRRHG
jgi:predicted O-methyltransferase YrrM